jgi:hypothetical protein
MNDSPVYARTVPSTKRRALTVVPAGSPISSPSAAASRSKSASAISASSSSPSASASSRKFSFQTTPTRSANTVGAIWLSCP